MTDEQVIINGIDVSGCEELVNGCDCCLTEEHDYRSETPYTYKKCSESSNCVYKQLKRKEQECNKFYIQLKADEEYHKEEENTLRKIIKNKEERNIELYKENNQLKAENEGLKRKIIKIFACLIKANRANKILDTLWVDKITTLWDYIALALGIEGDQTQIEEQILQKIREVANENK